MQGVFKIGGQTYLSSNQTANLPSRSWLGGTGAGQGSRRPDADRLHQGTALRRDDLAEPEDRAGLDAGRAERDGSDSSLEAFGVHLTGSAAANNVSLAQVYLKVTYYVMGDASRGRRSGRSTYHHNNVKYVHDPSDVPAGQRFAVSPAHGWYDALYQQDCYDFCHRGNGGAADVQREPGVVDVVQRRRRPVGLRRRHQDAHAQARSPSRLTRRR